MLYLAGARWVLVLLAIVTVVLCFQLPRYSVRGAASSGPTPTPTDLPVQQPGTTTTTPSVAAALPREAPAGLHGLGETALVVSTLPVYAWSKNAGDDCECAICLGEVRRGQVVKQLPACTHLFHARCIDKWLMSHATCPVCRTPVDSATALQLQAAGGVADQPPQ
ncbi:hypothetical protein E2562_019861 [Oryza meyeriana var. granulata]|uniref:RING-type E3 ubiquitin transferase n=1 Tax=Oryza meyeriana var. granulata TaxID=110450 RepID=A0A6G1CSS9_9ORYZ|nr:hypothetical protein E2562_019861 [Oryza meyeriana var. granulata]